MAYVVNPWWICLEGAQGPQGADGPALPPGSLFETSSAQPGQSPPAGAQPGDVVFNLQTGLAFQVAQSGAIKMLMPNTRTASLRAPLGFVGIPIGIKGVRGPVGKPGDVLPHDHGTSGIKYVPNMYQEMWQQSYIPVIPPAPAIVGTPALTNGLGNEVQVTIPPMSVAGAPHPFRPDVRSTLPSIGYSLLRVAVYRSAAAPTGHTAWLKIPDRVDFADVPNPPPGQTITVSLPAAWPGSATDSLWVVAYLWDTSGNPSPASPAVKATVTYNAPPMPDRTPPGKPTISVRWNEATQDYTVTVTAPSDPDLKEIHLWQNPSTTDPTTLGLIPTVLASTPGQVHTLTFKPALPPIPPGYPPVRWRWSNSPQHWAIEAAWYAVAYDNNKNGGDPGTAFDAQPATSIIFDPTYTTPPPLSPPGAIVPPLVFGRLSGAGGGRPVVLNPPGTPRQPKPTNPGPPRTVDVHMIRSKSRAYDKSGTRADNQWGQGIMHTGQYGSVHGNQWCGMWVDLSNLKGRTVVSMVLKWTMQHTFANSGGSFCVGYHTYENGMPATLPATSSRAHFGIFGHKRVPHAGGTSLTIPINQAQDFVDGQKWGFLFGGPHDAKQENYTAIEISSVHVVVKVR